MKNSQQTETTKEPRAFLNEQNDVFCVGYEWLGRDPPYRGPIARIEHDKVWLHITTDDYEGHAMLNIQTLPFLISALKKIERKIKHAKA